MRDLIEQATRETLVEFILAVIHGYTIMARDPDLSEEQRAIINNRIHYLVGHAWSLVKGLELNSWMIDGIAEHSAPLVPSLRKHADAILKKLDPGSSPG
ncbi:hypothetical protein [Erythrobacter colymbi]|uniref:hypothetical protein n=1 Tax=Erythrobacter colymbi TaxID=1161202 RepID=UPI000A3AB804|nr:hypothetical protein [Erythrobacter colymbi]